MDPSCLSIINRVVPNGSKVLFFLDFVKEFAPSLVIDARENDLPSEMLELIIVPSDTCTILQHVRAPSCREPAHTLVDDVVWRLVRQQRHNREKTEEKDNSPNALSNGFVAAREGEIPPAGMRPGVTRSHHNTINENMGFCKTSPLMQRLHEVVGDDVFRLILMHTRVFLPVPERNGSEIKKTRGNYILLCGPPLPSPNFRVYSNIKRQFESTLSTTAARPKKKKKHRRLANQTSSRSMPESLQPNASISRFALFYVDGYTPRVGLPSSHLFQKLPRCAPLKVLNDIFSLHKENKNKQRRLRKRFGSAGLRICGSILQGHSRCDYHRRLERYCPLPDCAKTSWQTTAGKDNDHLTQLAAGFTPQQRVVSFLGSVLREVFPCEFWGSERNFQSIMASVESFVHLRRKERLANKNLMHSIKVTHIKWLYPAIQSVGPGKKKPRSSQDTATALTLTMLRWVFQGFIIPLLRTNFYVTDTEFSANQVHYYRKPVWSLFRSLSVGKVLGGNHFREISFEKALGLIKEHQLGISKLRLLPKTTGVRPIAQLSRRQTVSFLVETVNSSKSTSSRKRANDRAMGLNTICPAKRTRIEEKSPMQRQKTTSSEQTSTPLLPRFPPTNLVLGDVLDVLRYECSSRMNPFGVGIDSLDFFHSKYREYIGLIKQTRGHHVLNLTFASVDIEKCFDRIHQDTLLKFVNDLLSHDGYVIQQIRLHDGTDRCANAFRIKRIAEPLDAYHPIHDGCKSLMVRSNRCIFDLFKSTLVDRRDLVRLLEEHIKDNMIVTSGRYRKKVLHQWTGISQGSSLSTILCNIYYGNMEKIMFVDFPLDQHDFMSRFVDDFLFVSTDEEKVKRFLHSSYRGIPELGVEVNGDKSAVSAKIEVVSSCGETICLSNGCRKGYNGRALFPWCGLLFDPETGAVSTDYQRFFQGRPRNSLTVDCDGQEGTRMEYRIQGFVFPRCLPILFDPVINCFEHTIMNFFQMMLFAAVKTAEYLRSLETLTSSRQRNALHVLRCIKVLPPYAIQTINGRLNSVLKQGGRRVNTAVSPRLATWLTWKGFHVVFASLSPEFTDLEQSIFDNLQPLGSVKISAKQVEIVSAAVSRGLDSMCLHRLIRKAY